MIALETKNLRALANANCRTRIAATIVSVFIVLAMAKQAQAQSADAPYPKMAAIDQYLMTQDAEVAWARSAAPESISKDADVLVLDRQGYHPASEGRNGFVCLVQRSWTASLDDPEFWNPKLRAPICLNPPAGRTYLPLNLKRTKLVLAGKTKEQLSVEMKAAFEAKELPAIEVHISQSDCGALLRLDKPGPGTAALHIMTIPGSVMVAFSFYFYGDQAAGSVARETPLWQAWLQERFPMPAVPSKGA